MTMALVEVAEVSKVYAAEEVVTTALRLATFQIASGEFVAVMGPSGSGKSTLLHILGCLDRPTSGQYFLADKNTADLSDQALAQLRNTTIGFVFQAFHLLSRASVLENVMLPLKYSRLPGSQHTQLAGKALADVGLAHRLDRVPSQLSGGEKQRVAIARAIVSAPQLILADEPTGNLDTASGKIVMDLLDQLHQAGRTIIVITHETTTARYAQRVLTMGDGQIVSDQVQDRVAHLHYQK